MGEVIKKDEIKVRVRNIKNGKAHVRDVKGGGDRMVNWI